MSFIVNLSPQSLADLNDIYDYIANQLQSPKNASSILAKLEESISSLNSMPERFRLYHKEPWNKRNLRIMPVDNYLVFYIPDNKSKVVTVLRVMYGYRDIDKQL